MAEMNMDFVPGAENEADAVNDVVMPNEEAIKAAEDKDVSSDSSVSLEEELDAEEQADVDKAEEPAQEAATEEENVLPVVNVEQEAAVRRSRGQQMRDIQEQNRVREQTVRERQMFRAGWDALNTARTRNTVLRAPVVAIEEKVIGNRENPDAPSRDIFVVAAVNGRYKIMIPFAEVFRDYPFRPDDNNNILNRKRQMANKLLHSDIEFCVTGCFAGNDNRNFSDYLCSGSRKKALEIITRRNFRTPRGASEPNLKIGSRTEATVVSVGMYALIANVGGVDTRIPVHNLTYRYVTDLRLMYKAGDKVYVEIRDIKEDANGNIILDVTARPLEIEEAQKRTHLIKERSSVVGTVTNVRHFQQNADSGEISFDKFMTDGTSAGNAGRTIVYAHLDDPLDLPARVYGMNSSALFNDLVAGDQIRMFVIGVGNDGVVNCAFASLFGPTGALLH